MQKRQEKLNTSMFVIDLLRRIPRHRKITASELHQELSHAGWKRDLRTIQRQLDELSDLFHLYIDRDDRNRPYGYSWKPNATGLTFSTLSPSESLLLSLAEQHLRYLLPSSVMKSLGGFFEAARMQLSPYGNAKKQKDWLSKILVIGESQPLIPPRIAPDVLEKVSNALYDNCWLNVRYQNAKGKRSHIDVMPLGLAQQGQRLYLVCRFKGFENERTLAMHRIKSAEILMETFDRPQFDLKKYDDDGRFGMGDGVKIRLRFHMDKACAYYILETPLSEDQTSEEYDTHYVFTATVTDSARLQRWLNGFGNDVWNIEKEAIKE